MVSPEHSVHLFVGSNDYLKEKAAADLKSSVLKGSTGDLDYKIFRAGEDNFREILDCVTTIPFLSGKRLVVIRDIEELDDQDLERLITYIKKPLKSTILVLYAKDDSFLDLRNGLAGLVSVSRFEDLTDAGLREWVKRSIGQGTSRGKDIEDEAIKELKELHGQNMAMLSLELEKLVAFVGERNEITSRDVEEVAGRSAFSSAFDLTGAIEKKNPDQALSIISDLAVTGKSHYEIIGLLCWHLRRVLRAKTLQAKGEPDYRIAGLLGINSRYKDEFFKQAKTMGIAGVRERLKLLLRADLDIKTSRLDPTLILEFAVIKLCLG